jgi:hypothetical protein
MSNSLIPDPLQMWRKAIAKLESGGNALANRAMDSNEFSSALHQIANLSLGMQQTFEKVLGTYLKKANLPSRAEIVELSHALQRIESKLDRLLPTEPTPDPRPRPARTRVPADRLPARADKPAAPAKRTPKKQAEPKTRRTSGRGG